jgi:hypothetical protein
LTKFSIDLATSSLVALRLMAKAATANITANQRFQERGYRVRLLSAAFRNHMHWRELMGGDVVTSPPYSWQVRFNASDVDVHSRINNPVEPSIVEDLSREFLDFRRSYSEDGISMDRMTSTHAARPAALGSCSALLVNEGAKGRGRLGIGHVAVGRGGLMRGPGELAIREGIRHDWERSIPACQP